MLADWRLCALDDFRLEHDGGVIGYFSADRTPDTLLAFVVAHRRPVSRDEVLDEFWPGPIDRPSTVKVNEKLSELRRRLKVWGMDPATAKKLIKVDGSRIVINPRLRIDVEEWEAELQRAAALPPEEAAVTVSRLREQFGAGPLPEFSQPWAERARAELRAQLELATTRVPRIALAAPAHTHVVIADEDDDDVLGAIDMADAAAITRQREAEHLLELLRETEPQLSTARREHHLTVLDGYRDRLSRVLEWAIESGNRAIAIGVAAHLWPWWHARHEVSGAARIERAMSLPGAGRPHDEALALHGAGTLAMLNGDLARAETRLRSAIEQWRAIDAPSRLARTLGSLSMCKFKSGDLDDGLAHALESLAIHRYLQETELVARRLVYAGRLHITLGNLREAHRALDEVLTIAKDHGDLGVAATAHELLGNAKYLQQDFTSAEKHYRLALLNSVQQGNQAHVVCNMLAIGGVLLARSEPDARSGTRRALDLFERAEAISRDVGDEVGVGNALRMRSEAEAELGNDVAALALCERSIAVLGAANHDAALSKAQRSLQRLRERGRSEAGD